MTANVEQQHQQQVFDKQFPTESASSSPTSSTSVAPSATTISIPTISTTSASATATTTAAAPPAADSSSQREESFAPTTLTLRALVSTKEAGIIIGKQGKNVADLREETGVKAGVTKVVPSVPDRVLSVTGSLDGVARAYAMASQTLIESPPANTNSPPGTTSIRLLISHNQMGSIIGRMGVNIKAIQDECSVRMVASKDTLPYSTERVVEVQGTADAIHKAVWRIAKCLLDDWERGANTTLYIPQARQEYGTAAALASISSPSSAGTHHHHHHHQQRIRTGNPADFDENSSHGGKQAASSSSSSSAAVEGDQTQNISIPADMVGCIIGRGGSKIQEIRRASGARISIAKQPHDESGERMFTIRGTPEENEQALYLLYEQLEHEKLRRQREQAQDDE
ncbi:hypothetical protein V1514DRAFT_330822 [Lipomyces japonicus]|uniref:uncharacterized protein n=1 Tax=Lipomyces japonicus TaxID=56871 RepID=UPI0034CD4AB7